MYSQLYFLILYFHLRHSIEIAFYFFFNDTATTEIYTLSLHDALPISVDRSLSQREGGAAQQRATNQPKCAHRYLLILRDRKSTRLNSSHSSISYAVFCLKKKIKKKQASYNKAPTIISFIVLN